MAGFATRVDHTLLGSSRTQLAAVLQIVVVRHVGFQAALRRVLRVAGDQLLLVPRRKEVEWIARVAVDELEVRAGHGELAESQLRAREIDVIRTRGIGWRERRGT